jgi:hypothetical protein
MKIKKSIVVKIFVWIIVVVLLTLIYLHYNVTHQASIRGRSITLNVGFEIVFPLWLTIPPKHTVDSSDTLNVICGLIKDSNVFTLVQTIDHSAGTILFIEELNTLTPKPFIDKYSWNCYLFVPDKANLFRIVLQHQKSSQFLYYTTECPSVFFEIKKNSFTGDIKELLCSHDFSSIIRNKQINLKVFCVMTKDGGIYFLH